MTLQEQILYIEKKIDKSGDAWVARSITDKEHAAVIKNMFGWYPEAMAAYRKDLVSKPTKTK